MKRERSRGDFTTMSKKGWGDDDDEEDLVHLLLPKGDLIKILVWLPVVSLLRFKSVCKSWLALIESSFFINIHTATTFNSSSSSSKFGSFILHASIDKHSRTESLRENELLMLSESDSESVSVSGGGCRWWWWSMGFNEITGRATEDEDDHPDFDDQLFKVDDDDDNTLVLKLDNLGFPPCYKICGFGHFHVIVGSCNGLVCLHREHTNEFSLWNPATRQFRLLPKNNIPAEDSIGPIRTLISFGFDVENKDYKLLLLTCYRPRFYHQTPVGTLFMECLCGVEVYSSRTDSWRLLEGITSLPGYPFGDFLDEVLHLNGSRFFIAKVFHTEQQPCFPENDRFLISFDFTKEIITSIQLPDHYHYQYLHLTYFGEKIALFTVDYHGTVDDEEDTGIYGYEDFNIWVLNEHGSISSSSVNKESWTKLHSFRIEHQFQGEWNIPRGISNDGKFALLHSEYPCGLGKKMKLYNLVTKELKKDFLFCNMEMSKAIPYKPSLVSTNQA